MAEPTMLAELAADLLAYAGQCLDDHAPAGAPECQFIGHGATAVPRREEYLSVQVDPLVPSVAFPTPANQVVRSCQELTWTATFTLRLHRCPYPHLVGDPSQPMPTPTEMTVASESLLHDVRVLQCCLPAGWAAGELFANPNLPVPPAGYDHATLEVIWGTITAFREGNKAGWDWPIVVGVTPCCELPAVGSGS